MSEYCKNCKKMADEIASVKDELIAACFERNDIVKKLTSARAEVAALKEASDTLHTHLSGEMDVTDLVYSKEGGLMLSATHPVCAYIAGELCSMFKAAGGINYVSLDVIPKDETIGPLELIIQRSNGKTPAQLNAERNAENERLTAENLDYDVALTQERERAKALRARLEAAEGIVGELVKWAAVKCKDGQAWHKVLYTARAHVKAQSEKAQEGKDKI